MEIDQHIAQGANLVFFIPTCVTSIVINIKNKKNYDFYAYQRSSKSYQKCIEESKKEYNHALKDYKGEEGKR